MVDLRLVVGDPGSRMTFQKTLQPLEARKLYSLKLGDTFKGESVGLDGYVFQITGGSNADGFPMRKDVSGTGKHKVLISSGPGLRPERKGERRRRFVSAHTVDEKITQLNVKVVTAGAKPLAEYFPKKEKPAEGKEKTEAPEGTKQA